MRYVTLPRCLLLATGLLSSCAPNPWLTGHTDSRCIREQMQNGSDGNGHDFALATRNCSALARKTQNGMSRPLDVRDDATLQAMAENRDFNRDGAAFVPRNSKARVPGGVRNINID